MRRRRPRSRRFGAVAVLVARDEQGIPGGSEIRYGRCAWRVDAWPDRLRAVEPCGAGIVVTFADGRCLLLEPEDAAA